MVDYTKIKELIFKLLKEKYPSSFESCRANYGEVKIFWNKHRPIFTSDEPFDDSSYEYGPTVGIYLPGFTECLIIPLTNKEFLELQLILEEVYPNWVQWRADDIEKTLTNLISPTNFDRVQAAILND